MEKESKNIVLTNTNLVKPICSLKQEYDLVKSVLLDVFERFKNEHNTLEYKNCLKSLRHYRYMNDEYLLQPGRYIKYINTTRAQELTLKQGGFIIEDLGFGIKIKSVVNQNSTWIVTRKKNLIFMKINQNETLRLACERVLNK
jgi:hypothetical protein